MAGFQEAGTIVSPHDKLRLSVLTVEPEAGMRGIVQISHGMSEYKERYLPLMEHLAARGYACIVHDHRGHGASVRSEKDLGFFYDEGEKGVIEDLRAVTAFAKERWPGAPLCLLGHSMGSLAARAYAKRYDKDIDALIVCGCPARCPAAGAGALFMRLCKVFLGGRHKGRLFDALVLGGFVRRFPDGPSPFAWVNSDEAAVKAYDDDPLCGFSFTLNGYLVLLGLMASTYTKKGWAMGNDELPILFISGEDDPCMISRERFDAAAGLMSEIGYRNVQSILYPGMRHEILNEPGKGEVYDDILSFLERSFFTT